MKNYTYKISLIFIALFVFLNAQQLQAQKNTVNLNYIFSKLTSQNGKSAEEINEELIKEISKRKVDFVLSSEDEESLKTSGANNLLIGTIDENASEEVREQIKYKLFSINCGKAHICPETEKAIKLGKQFIRIFRNVPEYELQITYLKNAIPRLEKEIAKEKQEQELNKVLTESVVKNLESDELKKDLAGKFIENYTGNIEQKKIALEAAKEFVKKFGEDSEIKKLIDYFKKRISDLEK